MTQDQVMAMLRQVLPFIAGLAAGKGWITTAQASDLMALTFQIAGPLMLVGSAIWSYMANSKTSIIKSATQMQEVDSKKLAAAIKDPDLKQAATQTVNQQQDKKS
jgi:hypothetical protein